MTAPDQARPSQGADRERQVQRIFSEIAPRYDLLNHLLSMNVDREWRRRAVDRLAWEDAPAGWYLDACAGTYDLSLDEDLDGPYVVEEILRWRRGSSGRGSWRSWS